MEKSVIQVLLPSTQSKCIFDYFCSEPLQLGTLVQVPFRNKTTHGIVWQHQSTAEACIYAHKIKMVSHAYKNIFFAAPHIAFIKFISWYNLLSLGSVLKLFLPFSSFDFLLKPQLAENIHAPLDLPSLNEEQARALKTLQAFSRELPRPILLEGVTGSGKTEVYLHLIEEVLREARSQVLILLPEVMLTNHFLSQLNTRSQLTLHAWHSNISKKEKELLWSQVATGEAKLVIGARSALFLPFKNLKLIVVDEEHDHSYKQEERLVYNARDMSVAYGRLAQIPIILSSATPSVETVYNTIQNKYAKANIASRYGDIPLAEAVIVNMKEEPLKKSKWLSESLIRATDNTLSAGKQAMFFLNRKGYAPITMCRLCGHKVGCKNCSTALVMYKIKNELLCHHCGYSLKNLKTCSGCSATGSFIHCGPGIDRLLEETTTIWPEKRIVAITKDSIAKDSDAAILLNSIIDGKVDIIIGTQVLSKGYHFPNLALVGIIDADIGFFGADLKASERTFQLLTQVAGRAGRESPGKVFIQTYAPENNLLAAMKANDKQKFYEEELTARQMMSMPPFSRLIALIFTGRTLIKLAEAVKGFASQLQYIKGIEVLGPVQAPLAKIRKHYRYRFLIKGPQNINVQDYIKQSLAKYKLPASIRVKVDVDPYSFL